MHFHQLAPDMSDCLTKGDFTTFTEHLKGLIAVYAIPNCGALDRARCWQALYHLERDLERLASRQAWIQDMAQLIHAPGGLGLVEPR